MNKETHSPNAAYATMTNIVVPLVQPGGVAMVQTRAKTEVEERLSGGHAGKTLNSASTLKQETA